MHLSYNSPCEIQGRLFLEKDPFMSGLGIYKDIDGEMWDVHGVIGGKNESYIQARKTSDSPSYYGTASWDNCYGSHSWKPYQVTIMKDKKIEKEYK